MNDSDKDTYHIGDIANVLGISQRTVRYYEELGFLRPSRTDGGFRIYNKHDANVLRMIIQFKDLGMRLEDIRALFLPQNDKLNGQMLEQLRTTLAQRKSDFEKKIQNYSESISQIETVLILLSKCSSCGEPSDKGVCRNCLVVRKKESGETPMISALMAADDCEEQFLCGTIQKK
jgi:DNA-binding transcriptional MerR regulator